MMLWTVIVSMVSAVAVRGAGNQLLPEDTLVQVARYLDSGSKVAMEKTSRSCASSVSKAREHEIQSLEIYRKYKDLIDNTNLTTEQIYKSFTWNPPVVGNGPAHHPKRVQMRNPCQVLSAGDVVNGGVHESYLAVKVITERFAGPFVVCFIFRNGQLDDQWFLRNGKWLDVYRWDANDHSPYSQIQDLILKQWVCFQNMEPKGPVIRSDASMVEKALLLVRRYLPMMTKLIAPILGCSLFSYYAPEPDMIPIIAWIFVVWQAVMLIKTYDNMMNVLYYNSMFP